MKHGILFCICEFLTPPHIFLKILFGCPLYSDIHAMKNRSKRVVEKYYKETSSQSTVSPKTNFTFEIKLKITTQKSRIRTKFSKFHRSFYFYKIKYLKSDPLWFQHQNKEPEIKFIVSRNRGFGISFIFVLFCFFYLL